jgi:hypothetical protein
MMLVEGLDCLRFIAGRLGRKSSLQLPPDDQGEEN